jgi:hypothetical protein
VPPLHFFCERRTKARGERESLTCRQRHGCSQSASFVLLHNKKKTNAPHSPHTPLTRKKKKKRLCHHRKHAAHRPRPYTGRAPCPAVDSPARGKHAGSPRRAHRHRWRALANVATVAFTRRRVHASSQYVAQTHLRRSWAHPPWTVGREEHARSTKPRAQPQ